jgi:hypothetical protein
MGRQGGFGYYSLGVKKDFKNKKGSIGMSAQNFLANSLKIKSNIETPQFYQNSVNQMFNRGINLNLSYKIGKSGANAMQPRKRAKGVSNDDVKEGGGDTSSQQQPAQSTGRPR